MSNTFKVLAFIVLFCIFLRVFAIGAGVAAAFFAMKAVNKI